VAAAVDRFTRLDDGQATEVEELADRLTSLDGVAPLTDHARLRLSGSSSVSHLLVRRAGSLVGYAQVEPAAEGAVAPGTTAEIAALDSATVELLVDAASRGTPSPLRIWGHGERSTVSRALAGLGLSVDRVLLQMRRSLLEPLDEPEWPEGVTVRTFVVGEDEQTWVDVNNAAFADHREQSGWTVEDVVERERKAWFDPAGLFLAEQDGEVVGFHWTKVHDDLPGQEPIGEVYVVGVSPKMQGKRLGLALTLLGLQHLKGKGIATGMLYVDEPNTAAVRLYERIGFARWDADTQYRR
jgi:mycothiol synthase